MTGGRPGEESEGRKPVSFGHWQLTWSMVKYTPVCHHTAVRNHPA